MRPVNLLQCASKNLFANFFGGKIKIFYSILNTVIFVLVWSYMYQSNPIPQKERSLFWLLYGIRTVKNENIVLNIVLTDRCMLK
jgi:hypothetical protein